LNPLYEILHPKSIAYLGGSNSLTTPGTPQLINILASGFSGKVFPIHLKEKTVLGLKAYRSILELPYPVDLAVLVIPARAIPTILRECGQKGIKRAIIITAGFSEVGDKPLEQEIQNVANEFSIRFIGPNCLGVNNPHNNFNCTWFPYHYKKGHFSLVSQSGSYSAHINRYLENNGIAVRCAISVGNQANIDTIDCLEYLKDDEYTKVIGLYLEGVKDGRRFLETARRVSLQKPIVALYVGGTEAGARSGSSHTAALSAPDEIYNGAFKQAGIIRAYSVEEMLDFSLAFANQPLPKGNRVAILTNSGGPATSMADTCNREGLAVPVFSDELQKKIQPFLLATAIGKNPVDLTMTLDTKPLMVDIPRLVYEFNEADAILFYGLFGTRHAREKVEAMKGLIDIPAPIEKMESYLDSLCDSLVKFASETGLPVLGSSFWSRDDRPVAYLQDRGIPMYISPERATRSLAAMWRYRQWLNANISDS